MTAEEIAQWVIDNRYPKAESEKVADFEMFHHLVSSIKSYGMGEWNEAIEKAAESACVYQHSRDYKVSSIAPIVRQKIMISEVYKDSILKLKKP